MSPSLERVGVITLYVEDPQRSKTFYTGVFGVPAIFEDGNSAVVKFENLLVNLLQAGKAPTLIAPAPVADSGSRFLLTIWVDDADAVCAQLAERGVELLNGPVDREWGVRTAAFADPDGHAWEVAQQLT